MDHQIRLSSDTGSISDHVDIFRSNLFHHPFYVKNVCRDTADIIIILHWRSDQAVRSDRTLSSDIKNKSIK